MSLPTPFIIYTNKDKSGWVRYVQDSLDGENSDLARMTVEELTLRSEKGNRKLCVISPMLALAVMNPERADESIKPGVHLERDFLLLVDSCDFTHESIALAPYRNSHIQLMVQSKKRKQDTTFCSNDWTRQLNQIYELSQSEQTGDKTVKAILDIGPVPNSEGRSYEIVLEWNENTGAEIYEHIRELKRLCKA